MARGEEGCNHLDERLREVEVLVAHDVEDGEHREGDVEDDEPDGGRDEHQPPRNVQEALAHDVQRPREAHVPEDVHHLLL